MRPLRKLPAGATVALPDGTSHTVQHSYHPYGEAKGPLCCNFGCCCVYCETSYDSPRDLHVEHILPKSAGLGYAHLANSWDNFLLSCATCNGADNKGNKVALPQQCHFPHLNNTFLSLRYEEGGVVMANPDLTGLSYDKAKVLVELVGLDKTPATSSPCDYRWKVRYEKWNIACRYRALYDSGFVNTDFLIDYVKSSGFWSIWFTVFRGVDDVRRRLIEEFPGTEIDCFDPLNHYEPVNRNTGQADPV